MSERKALLVGSLPFENEEESMKKALDFLGESLISCPDGEVGERSERYPNGSRSVWIIHAIDRCVDDQENWEILKEGDYRNGAPKDYQSLYKLRPKHSPKEMIHHLNFHYHDFFDQSYPVFQRLREERNLTHLPFQVGIPTGLAFALFALQPLDAFRYIDTFNRRFAEEVNEICQKAGEDVIVQIEIPAELGLADKLPSFLSGLPIRFLLNLINYLSESTNIGVHMCYGDLNNKGLTQPKTLKKVVHFANTLVKKWPNKHQLKYVHFPLASGDQPPTLHQDYYQPLEQLQLPDDTRFVAGFVHEGRSLEELQQIQQHLDDLFDQPVDIACSCGLGRRTPEAAETLLQLTKDLLRS